MLSFANQRIFFDAAGTIQISTFSRLCRGYFPVREFSIRIRAMKKIICAICAICGLLSSCDKKLTPEQIEAQNRLAEEQRLQAIEQAKDSAISEYADSLSEDVKISQLFLVNIEGNQKYHSVEKTSDGKALVPGGVLLFSYNISKDPLETYDFIKSIHDFYIENQNIPPFVAVDQEGGDVNRLRGLTSVLWGQKKVAESFSPENAANLYSAQARQMRNLGFHLNLAPVIEAENESNKDFLDTRTFGSLQKVLSYGRIAIDSYEQNGISVVLKHFPGNSSVDPHVGLPKIIFDESERDNYFKPFEELLPKSSAVLMSHAIMKPKNADFAEKYDMPACFSKYWISDCVRDKFGFNGLVFSDDIFMGALAKNGYPPQEACVKAIDAGVDVIMLSEKRFGHVAEILQKKAKEDDSFAKELDRAVKNVIRYKIKAGILLIEENEQIPAENSNVLENEMTIPSFSVKINPKYEEFDLKKFDEDYKQGMKAYN